MRYKTAKSAEEAITKTLNDPPKGSDGKWLFCDLSTIEAKKEEPR